MFVEAEADLVGEFLVRASQKRGNEPGMIQVYRKEYRYQDERSGELLASKDAIEFIRLLMKASAPLKTTRNDDTQNAFLYICGRLKISGSQQLQLIEALDKPVDVQAPSDTVELKFTGQYGDESDDVIED